MQQLRTLQLGVEGFRSLQQLANEFGARKDCTGSACRYEFENGFGMSTFGTAWTIRRTEWDYFRLRPWRVLARVETNKDAVTDIEFVAFVGRGRGYLYNKGLFRGSEWGWLAVAVTVNSERFEHLVTLEKEREGSATRRRGIETGAHGILIQKPALEIGGGGEGLRVLLADDASPQSRRIGFDVSLRCATAVLPCTELCQLAPSVWQSYSQYVRSNGYYADQPADCAVR